MADWMVGAGAVAGSGISAGSGIDGDLSLLDESSRVRLLEESWRVVVSKHGALLRAVVLSSGYDESDIRQECLLKGWQCVPYAVGDWRVQVNYVSSVMANYLRDLSRYWQVRTRAGVDAVQVGSLGVLGDRADGESYEDYVVRKELESLRARVGYLEWLVGLDPDLESRYRAWCVRMVMEA